MATELADFDDRLSIIIVSAGTMIDASLERELGTSTAYKAMATDSIESRATDLIHLFQLLFLVIKEPDCICCLLSSICLGFPILLFPLH